MKLIIAGSRSLHNLEHAVDLNYILQDLELNTLITEVVSGGCTKGPDKWAKDFILRENKYCSKEDVIQYTQFNADWDRYGRSAGPKRNAQMAKYGDALLLIWDGKSKGSLSMKNEILKLNKPIFEIVLKF